MEKIVFLDSDSIVAAIRRPAFPHRWEDYPATAPDQVLPRLIDASIAITNKVALHRETLEQLPGLKMVAVAATGTDNVDIACCRARNIVVSNIRNYSVHTVPEHVFMLMLALRRNLLAFRDDLRNGAWQRADQFCLFTHPVRDLHGSTLGLIGHGAIGQAVERLALAFGMKVLIAEHKGAATVRPGYTAFDSTLRGSDVISLHVPLNPQTRHLISTTEFGLMKPNALLINTARGGLVDESALLDALRTGRIGGAGFDVLGKEPPQEGNPLLDLDSPNFILTPHIAWSGRAAMQTLADQLIDNIEAYLRGAPQNRVA
ncbi:lactate dehydrogenase [Sulfuriferula plumbiphila]|uniref:Lactate dehydrogenase n=1 Tax=Sulfuriferula plumbiphila TaxID=171865 RepID=A0A512L556_9PROT|nr:D-2-hydroxyacid dehydrogenase [Sulfuriferula plumbiphila]BBP05849.1 lactate dehydrogenase [Sulfuriferula plumbiphila]GEP29619.1 lactate dehydrogenase [Sulfuriferula plumbiphila]